MGSAHGDAADWLHTSFTIRGWLLINAIGINPFYAKKPTTLNGRPFAVHSQRSTVKRSWHGKQRAIIVLNGSGDLSPSPCCISAPDSSTVFFVDHLALLVISDRVRHVTKSVNLAIEIRARV